MNKFSKLLLLLCALLSTVTFASTTTRLTNNNDAYTVGKGDVEVNFGLGSQFLRGDADADIFNLQLGANYFIDDMFAPGIDFQITDYGSGSNTRFVPNLKAYWPLHSRVLPYAQVGLGYADYFNASGFAFGFGAGINYLLSDSVAIGAKLAYEVIAGDATIHQVSIPIGFNIYFKI